MSKLSDKIIGTIQEGKITPKPRWYFTVKNIFFWALSGIFIFLGIFFATVFFVFASELELFDFLGNHPAVLISLTLFGIFFFWGGLAAIASVISKLSISLTKKGYKYPTSLILSTVLLFQAVSGLAFSQSSHIQKKVLYEKPPLPFLHHIENEKKRIWNNPEKGFLVGKIDSVLANKIIVLSPKKQKKKKLKMWHVHLTESTNLASPASLEIGKTIRIHGEKTGENKFQAQEIFPFQGKRKDMKHMMKKHGEIRKETREEMREERRKMIIDQRKNELLHSE